MNRNFVILGCVIVSLTGIVVFLRSIRQPVPAVDAKHFAPVVTNQNDAASDGPEREPNDSATLLAGLRSGFQSREITIGRGRDSRVVSVSMNAAEVLAI